MRSVVLVSIICSAAIGAGCAEPASVFIPTQPTTTPTVTQPPTFPSIQVGEAVRFRFTNEESTCAVSWGACRSFDVTAPSDGQLEILLRPVDGGIDFIATTELYVVPGADSWNVGPGAQIGASVPARKGATYEIRMSSAKVPSVEMELRARLQ